MIGPRHILSLGSHRPPAPLQAYNACMHGCLFHKSSSELAALSQCDAILQRIAELSLKALTSAKRAGRRSVLPSRLTIDCGVTPLEALSMAKVLRAQVRLCLDRAQKDLLLSMLDNDAKRQIAGFAGRCGTHALKALRYRSADFDRSKSGLLYVLEDYGGRFVSVRGPAAVCELTPGTGAT